MRKPGYAPDWYICVTLVIVSIGTSELLDFHGYDYCGKQKTVDL